MTGFTVHTSLDTLQYSGDPFHFKPAASFIAAFLYMALFSETRKFYFQPLMIELEKYMIMDKLPNLIYSYTFA